MLNKPAGYECSRKPQHHPSVLELLPRPLREREMQPIGRLDDTTGLLLITDDGQLNHQLSSAAARAKIYLATTKHPLDQAQIDQRCWPAFGQRRAGAEPAAGGRRDRRQHLLRLTVTEGKYHQVKRMVAAAGDNRVEALHRGWGTSLPGDLPPGEWRAGCPRPTWKTGVCK